MRRRKQKTKAEGRAEIEKPPGGDGKLYQALPVAEMDTQVPPATGMDDNQGQLLRELYVGPQVYEMPAHTVEPSELTSVAREQAAGK